MREVISRWKGDGVFTGRAPHNSHRNHMKHFNAIATAAVIGASFIAITPAVKADYYYQEVSDSSRLDEEIRTQQKRTQRDQERRKESTRRSGF